MFQGMNLAELKKRRIVGMLTRKQYEILIFINDRLSATGISPSFDEMKDALGLRSKSGIHRLITGLEERGFIRRLPHRARALEVLKLPENSENPNFSPNVIKGDFFIPAARKVAEEAESMRLPLYGKIAAGTPIDALRSLETVDIPAFMLAGGKEHYALTVEGDSMIDEGIREGDTVVVERADTAENGRIVVALIDDNEVTLKRIRKKGGTVALEPANTRYETRIFGPDRVRVQGCLIGLLRKY